jgi:hypothetical protein
MKLLQNGRFSDFQKGQSIVARVAGATVTKTATLLSVSRAAVVMVDVAHQPWEDIIR